MLCLKCSSFGQTSARAFALHVKAKVSAQKNVAREAMQSSMAFPINLSPCVPSHPNVLSAIVLAESDAPQCIWTQFGEARCKEYRLECVPRAGSPEGEPVKR